MSVMIRGGRRSVRPLRHRNHELGHWLRSTIKVWIGKNRRASLVCPPSHIVSYGNVKHKMWNPVSGAVVQSPLLRHHVTHCARLEGRQFLVLNCGSYTFLYPFSRFSSQDQVCPLQSDLQNGSGGLGIKAGGTSIFSVPKFWTVELTHPCAFYDTDKAVLAFHRSFITMRPEDHNRGVT